MGIVREFKKKQRRKYMKIGGIVAVVLLIGFVIYFNFDTIQNTVPEEWFAFEATGTIQHHTDFVGRSVIINPDTKDQFLYFINSYPNLQFFTKTYESPAIISYTGGTHLTAGTSCDWGELIRFTYCDTANDKNTCNTDIFARLWQVHEVGNYPDFYNYHTREQTFYFSYSCYDAQATTYPEIETEKRYLENGKCVNPPTTNNYVEYDSQLQCEEALQNIPDEEVYDCYVCENGQTGYTQVTEASGWSCQETQGTLYTETKNQCEALHPEYFDSGNDEPATKQISCFKCEPNDLGAVVLTKPNDWNCRQDGNILYTTTLAQCQNIHPEYFNGNGGNNNDDPNTSTCKAYQSLDEGVCKFSFNKILTIQGLGEYWNDEPIKLSLFVVLVGVLGWLLYDIYAKKGGKKKK